MTHLSEHRFLELKATGDLPSPTGVALTVLEHMQNKQVSTADITSTIQADPALAGRLIKLANSFGEGEEGGRPTVSLAETISRVGAGVTRQITIGLSVLSSNMDGECSAFDYQNFWSYSLAMGVSTELFSNRDKLFPKDEAFTVGLLSNIGRLGLANVYPEQYSEILEANGDKPINELLEAEVKYFYTDHLEMAHAMLKDWGLPPVHYNAIYGMYDISKVANQNHRAQSLAQYLNLSAKVATICTQDLSVDHPLFNTLLKEALKLNIDNEELRSIVGKTKNIWNNWSQLLDVPEQADAPSESNDAISQEPISPELINLEQTIDRGLQVLIADNDIATSNSLYQQLTNAGHLVTKARTGKEALQLALEINPQLLITDITIPEMDGLELCRSLRRTAAGQKMYIIAMTTNNSEEALISAFKAGADDFIEKPFSPNVVLARIRGGQRVFRLQKKVRDERNKSRKILAELASANKQLEQAALTDQLTNIPNRRYATNRLEQEWATSNRGQVSLSCMLIDIDLFKGINDKYGHDAGDAVLYEVAQALRTASRLGDEVCRIGGEEFLVICTNTDMAEAEAAAERLRTAVENLSTLVGDNELVTTVSIGVATRHPHDVSTNDLLKAADIGVYTAKANGRNCIYSITERSDAKSNSSNKGSADHVIHVAPQPCDVAPLS